MNTSLVIFLVCWIKFSFGQLVFSTTNTPSEDEYLTRAYCFQFTWLGPKYNDESTFYNATCSDIKTAKNVPCIHPLVVTNNSNVPDTNYLWQKYRRKPRQVACRLVRGEVCAKYSYIFNGALENITYFCSKIKLINDTREIDNDCFTQRMGAREIEVCVCRSRIGMPPCNFANSINVRCILLILLLILILSVYQKGSCL